MTVRSAFLALALLLGLAAPAAAQQQAGRDDRFHTQRPDTSYGSATEGKTWTPFFDHEGVAFSFIRYRHAAGRDAGVVLRLVNENDFAVRYRLRLAFLSMKGAEERWRTGRAAGVLQAGQMKTGAKDSLFWVPFRDSSGIAEVRLPRYQITRIE